jgi:DegV family protein with EDD domain
MIKIVTDSTAYLPETYVREHDIRVVPLNVHFDKVTFKEGVELSNEDFYARLKAAPALPTTSQPSAGEFLEVFEELSNDGYEIVVLTISSKLSGTWNSAMAAKEMLPEAKISVIDSLSTSVGLHLMVEAAADAIAAGAAREEVVASVEAIIPKMRLLFVVDTLEYLAKGGRIGNARAFLGTLLNVKPILALQDGVIEPLEQVRSKRKAQARMLDLVEEYMGKDAPKAKTGIINALAPEEAARLVQEVTNRLGCAEPIVGTLGGAIGTHTGPGVIGIAAYV